MDELRHLWCTHCNESVCGLRTEEGFEPDEELAAGEEALECIVCADHELAVSKFSECLLAVLG